jgi:hypothetical protein
LTIVIAEVGFEPTSGLHFKFLFCLSCLAQ